MGYINLRTNTAASLDYGFLDVEAALKKCQSEPSEYGMAFAVTERNNMYSVVDFYKKGQSISGFNPIVGIDLDIVYEEQTTREYKGEKIVDVKRSVHPVLMLARNHQAYLNLCRLQTFLSENKKTNGVDFKDIQDNPDLLKDVIVLSGGNDNGFLFRQFILWQDNPDDRPIYEQKIREHILFWKERVPYFVELQRYGFEQENEYIRFIVPIANELGVPVVATNPTYFLNRSDYASHERFMGHKNNYSVFSPYKSKPISVTPENYFKSASEMADLFKDLPIALENSVSIAQACEMEFNLGKEVYLPEIASPNPEETLIDYFKRLSLEGLHKRLLTFLRQYGQNGVPYPSENSYFAEFDEWRAFNIDVNLLSAEEQIALIQPTQLYQKYVERLNYEMDVIINMKFPSYFMVVADFVQWCKDNNIAVGKGRGSGAGSLVAYSLAITDIDPLQFNLLFERFLNPERVSMPDFDIDFPPKESRDKVIHYVTKKYNNMINVNEGDHRHAVSGIMNVVYYKTKSAIESAANAYGFKRNDKFVDEIKKMFDANQEEQFDEEEVEVSYGSDFFEHVRNNKKFWFRYHNSNLFKSVVNLAAKLYGNMRSVGQHASGIVITSKPIDDILPIVKNKTMWLTQLNKDNSEALGVIKFDFLALENLRIMQYTLEEINKKRDKKDYFTIQDLNEINLYDQKVYQEIFQKGNTENVFQFSSSGMVQMLIDAKPNCFEDLVALVALYRPGPIDLIPTFIKRKHKQEPIVYLHEKLKPILEETMGIFVYQEQVMRAAQIIAGYSLGGADILRRAMGKKKPEEMQKQRDIFRQGAIKNGIDQKKADEIFDDMEKFAHYGFNKSHAAAYAAMAFQTAFLKCYYPKEYLLAVLKSKIMTEKKGKDILPVLQDAKNNQVNVKLIDINHSTDNFYIDEQGDIMMPFNLIKGFSSDNSRKIQNIRKRNKIQFGKDGFESVNHCIADLLLNDVSEKVIEQLIRLGCLDKLMKREQYSYVLANISNIAAYIRSKREIIHSPILKSVPNKKIKNSVKKVSGNKDIQFVKDVIDYYPYSHQLKDSVNAFDFVPDLEPAQGLSQAYQEGYSLITDGKDSISSLVEFYPDVEKKLRQAYTVLNENNTSDKYKQHAQQECLVAGFLVDKPVEKNFKIELDIMFDGCKQSHKMKWALPKEMRPKALNLTAFDRLFFKIEAKTRLDNHSLSVIPYLQDIYQPEELMNQVMNQNKGFILENSECHDIPKLAQWAGAMGEEVHVHDKKAPCLKVKQDDQELEMIFNENLAYLLKKNNVQIKAEWQADMIFNRKINVKELTGVFSTQVKSTNILEAIKSNKAVQYVIRHTPHLDIYQPKNEYLLLGYIKSKREYKGKISQYIFVNQNGDEYKIKVDENQAFSDNKKMALPLNELCMIKVDYYFANNNQMYLRLVDHYNKKDIEAIYDKREISIFIEHKDDLENVLLDNGIHYEWFNHLSDKSQIDYSKQMVCHLRTPKGAVLNQYFVIDRGHPKLAETLKEMKVYGVFNCDKSLLTAYSVPPKHETYEPNNGYQRLSRSEGAKKIFEMRHQFDLALQSYLHSWDENPLNHYARLSHLSYSSDKELMMMGLITHISLTSKQDKYDICLFDGKDYVSVYMPKDKVTAKMWEAYQNHDVMFFKIGIEESYHNSNYRFFSLTDVFSPKQAELIILNHIDLNDVNDKEKIEGQLKALHTDEIINAFSVEINEKIYRVLKTTENLILLKDLLKDDFDKTQVKVKRIINGRSFKTPTININHNANIFASKTV